MGQYHCPAERWLVASNSNRRVRRYLAAAPFSSLERWVASGAFCYVVTLPPSAPPGPVDCHPTGHAIASIGPDAP
jgi:hypothetical protein